MCVVVDMVGVGTNDDRHRFNSLFQRLRKLYRIAYKMRAQATFSCFIVSEGYSGVKHSCARVGVKSDIVTCLQGSTSL